MILNERVLVMESEAVHEPAVGCIVWLDDRDEYSLRKSLPLRNTLKRPEIHRLIIASEQPVPRSHVAAEGKHAADAPTTTPMTNRKIAMRRRVAETGVESLGASRWSHNVARAAAKFRALII